MTGAAELSVGVQQPSQREGEGRQKMALRLVLSSALACAGRECLWRCLGMNDG
ncbi:hypothetical protein IG631_04455 [Alternaria alternata]|nr:hypothetical protein IG631_04455 [Alternaria alternata]